MRSEVAFMVALIRWYHCLERNNREEDGEGLEKKMGTIGS
jgi:hypothetical protein